MRQLTDVHNVLFATTWSRATGSDNRLVSHRAGMFIELAIRRLSANEIREPLRRAVEEAILE